MGVIFYCNVKMKGKDLLVNLKEARDHINRLKKEAALYEDIPDNPHLKQYFNEAVYSLIKNEQQLQIKHKTFKLPTILQKREDTLLHTLKKPSKKEDSFVVENRPMKMHSFQQKHTKVEYSTRTDRLQSIQIIFPQQQAKDSKESKRGSRSSHFRRRPPPRILNITSEVESISANHTSNAFSHEERFQLKIVNGRLNTDSPQYSMYQRVYASCMPKILQQMHRLQKILSDHKTEYAVLDGRKLAFLALQHHITPTQLIECLIECSVNIIIPEQKYTKVEAVNKIVSFLRMKITQRKYLVLKASTIRIQAFFRRKLSRLHLEQEIYEKNQRILSEWGSRQTELSEKWKQIKHERRVEIHINTIEIDEERRLTIENYQERQNIQLSRIFRLKDDNVIMIFITATQLPTELTNYYSKMMELAGITNHRDRLVYLTPEAATTFPSHFSLARLLYYSPRAMRQLRLITEGLTTILYPGQPCNHTVKICHTLQCYMFSGEPQRMRSFTHKTQVKRLLKNLSLDTLPGTMEMYDYGEFLNTFSVLIIKNPVITTWVLKIDDQFAGRGIAYVDFSRSSWFRSAMSKAFVDTESGTFATDVPHDNHDNQQLTIQIRDYLKEHLQQKLVIATPTLYKSYEHFIGRFIKKGGIIEAHPPCPKEHLTYPSISFALDPDGDYKIITTYQKIIGQPYRPIGCSFPQQSLEYSQVSTLLRQICDSFKLRKIFGIFTVDLISYKKQKWVIDVNPYLNDYTSSFYLFDLLMGGSFLPESATYLVEDSREDKTQSVDTMPSVASDETAFSTRTYIYIPHFTFRHSTRLDIREFFRQARIKQFNFDVAEREGVCLLLLDQLASGTMGLLAVAHQPPLCILLLLNILQFIADIAAVKNVQYGRTEYAAPTDAFFLKDILSVFKGAVRKQKRKGAKDRAVQMYAKNRGLDHI